MPNPETKPHEEADESIGRPSPWGEGRYEEGDEPAQESVVRKPKEAPPDTVSTPVTIRDYEQRSSPESGSRSAEACP